MFPETSTDTLSPSVVEGAAGSAMVVATGVTTCSVAVCSTVVGPGAGALAEIGSFDAELRKRRPV
jgi:hypothetical protein